MKIVRYCILVLAVVADIVALAGCSDDFDPASKLEGLRIIDVSVAQSYAPPGSTIPVSMKAVESSAKAFTTLWLPGCESPDGDLPRQCTDALNERIATMTPEQLSDQGPDVRVTLPADLISRRPPPVEGTTPYGLSFLFYAVCTGELRYIDPPELELALGCFDGDRRVDASGFVTGYSPIFAYDDAVNNAPVIADIQLPETVRTCRKKDIDDCPDVHVGVVVDPSQSELDTVSLFDEGPIHEGLWAAFFATVGELESDTQQIADTDGVIRDVSDSRGNWHIEPGYTGPATVYVTLFDSRGGSTWMSRDVVIEP